MKVDLYDIDGEKKGSRDLPDVFTEEIRPDIINRAVKSAEANQKQPYGPTLEAGMRHATESEGKGQGISRVQRLTQYGNDAAESPPNVGGRRAHPPKVEKERGKKVNEKEKTKARRSALAAASQEELIRDRGHEIDRDDLTFPLVVEKRIEELEKTKEGIEVLENLGIYSDVKRSKDGKNIRAGRGKMRNRKYRQPVSILLVLPDGAKGRRAFRNLPGVDVKDPKNLTITDLAPGGDMGRLTIFSVKALKQMEEW